MMLEERPKDAEATAFELPGSWPTTPVSLDSEKRFDSNHSATWEGAELDDIGRSRGLSFEWQERDEVSSLISLQREVDGLDPTSPNGRSTGTVTSTVASRMRYAEPSQTLIFFDWDDTLFPTTEVFDRWGFPSSAVRWPSIEFTKKQRSDLGRWASETFLYLTVACSLSDRVVVVTNSRRPWVEDCVKHFAPNLLPLFDPEGAGLRVVYAREHLKPSRSCRPTRPPRVDDASPEERDELQTKAKFYAMQKEVKDFYSQYEGQSWKNIISIGDMRYEHDAVQEVTFQRHSPARERLRTKAIIVWEAPSLEAMTVGCQIWRHLLPAAVHFDGDFDMDFSRSEDRLKTIAHALELPELPELSLPLSAFARQLTPEDRLKTSSADALELPELSELSIPCSAFARQLTPEERFITTIADALELPELSELSILGSAFARQLTPEDNENISRAADEAAIIVQNAIYD